MALTNAQRTSRYRAKHPDRVRSSNKRYRDENVEQHRAYWRKNYATNPNSKAIRERYRVSHPEVFRSLRQKRRAQRLGNGGWFTAEEWIALKKFHGHRCLCCGKHERSLHKLGRKLVPDHVRALSRNGLNSITNIQPLCHGRGGCNNRKGTKFIDYRRNK